MKSVINMAQSLSNALTDLKNSQKNAIPSTVNAVNRGTSIVVLLFVRYNSLQFACHRAIPALQCKTEGLEPDVYRFDKLPLVLRDS
jgi:hypothetical protein